MCSINSTQLNTAGGLSILAACTVTAERPAAQPDKSRGSNFRYCESAMCLWPILVIKVRCQCGSYSSWRHEGAECCDQSAPDVSQTHHAEAIRQIRHLLSAELAQTLACSLILSRINYCNTVLHGAPTGTIQKLQRVQENAARIVLQASRISHAKPLLHQLHWLPVQQWITYKLAFLTYKVWSTSTPAYLNDQITEHVFSRTLHSSAILLLV